MFQYDLFKIEQMLRKADKPVGFDRFDRPKRIKGGKHIEEKPIGLVHPQEAFGKKITGPPKETDKPVITGKPRHRDMSKLIPKVIREKVVRNGTVFFRNRTVFVKIEELPAHDKKVEILLPQAKFMDKFWIYYSLKSYAGKVGFTEMAEKSKKNAIWRDKKFKLHYFEYKRFTEVPQKSILVYNNKLEEKVLLIVKMMRPEQEEQGGA